jgi:hypothetical protein
MHKLNPKIWIPSRATKKEQNTLVANPKFTANPEKKVKRKGFDDLIFVVKSSRGRYHLIPYLSANLFRKAGVGVGQGAGEDPESGNGAVGIGWNRVGLWNISGLRRVARSY